MFPHVGVVATVVNLLDSRGGGARVPTCEYVGLSNGGGKSTSINGELTDWVCGGN